MVSVVGGVNDPGGGTRTIGSHHDFCCFSFVFISQAPKAPDKYDPNRSRVSDDKMNEWLNDEIVTDLCTVPGIGPAFAKKLNNADIWSVHHLIGKYLSETVYDAEDDGTLTMDVYSTNQKFFDFLRTSGVTSTRSGIVNAINRKVAASYVTYNDSTVDYDAENMDE
jgi:hypothetical protein